VLGAIVTIDSMACSPAKIRVEIPGASSRNSPSSGWSRLWNSSLWLTSLSLFARQLCGMGGSAISGSTGMPRQPISK
jgi:hypothetical protein